MITPTFFIWPSSRQPLLPQNLPLYLEFIQHHLLMGASHIFITAAFAWGGNIMKSLQRVLRSFIEDGSVSMTSHADDALDFLYSVRGLSFYRDNLKVFQVVYLMHYLILLWCIYSHGHCLIILSSISSSLNFFSFFSPSSSCFLYYSVFLIFFFR